MVCGPVNGQKVKFVKSNYPFLKNLKLPDEGLHNKKIDLMIGTDFCWDIVDGSVKRGDSSGCFRVKIRVVAEWSCGKAQSIKFDNSCRK